MTAAKKGVPQLLPKVPTGIDGFDELSQGGLPRNRITLLKGGPGSGKTVFALQSLVNAARRREETGHLHCLRGKSAANHRQRRQFRLGPACPREKQDLFHGCEFVARGGAVRRIRPERPAGHAQGKEGGDERTLDRVRRHRCIADAAAEPEGGNPRDLPYPRLAGGERGGRRDHHGQGRWGRVRRWRTTPSCSSWWAAWSDSSGAWTTGWPFIGCRSRSTAVRILPRGNIL